MSTERKQIADLAKRFRARAKNAGLSVSGDYHISGLHISATHNVKQFEEGVRSRGFYLKVSQYPSRPREAPCARVAFTPFHTSKDVDGLVDSIVAALGEA
jgi:7-keto-8-aminopelargonate synthetase-like enzyme